MVNSSGFRRGALFVGTIGVALLAGFLLRAVRGYMDETTFAILWLALPLGLGLAFGCAWWRALDEVAREAHKAAWWWGGSFGMVAALVALALLERLAPDLALRIEPGASPAELLLLGALAMILTQAAGYLVFWLFWWGARR